MGLGNVVTSWGQMMSRMTSSKHVFALTREKSECGEQKVHV